MRIGMLLDKPFPPDPRVANEARSLVQAGHSVALFCLGFGGEPPRETLDGVEIVRHPIDRRFWKKASALILTLPAYRLWFRGRLRRFLSEERIEALHVHDLPLVGEGLRAARAAGIPLVADLHENYPAAIRLYDWARRLPGRVLVRPSAWDRYERTVVPRADRVIVVIEEARERLVRLGVDRDRIAVVENTVHVDEFEGFAIDQRLIDRFRDRFAVTYVGNFDRHRGLETAIDAAVRAREAIPGFELVLVGTGATAASLARRVQRLGLGDCVTFEGWQPFSRFPSYIRASAVSLIPHLKTPHTDTTIPHKLFHTMLLERAVVASDCAPIERIVHETGCGVIFPSGEAGALAEALALLRDPALRAKLGAAGRAAVLARYRWDVTARRLLELYDRLAARAGA
jgi:glycosyltransferase involved in cell wall biosynthesis